LIATLHTACSCRLASGAADLASSHGRRAIEPFVGRIGQRHHSRITFAEFPRLVQLGELAGTALEHLQDRIGLPPPAAAFGSASAPSKLFRMNETPGWRC